VSCNVLDVGGCFADLAKSAATSLWDQICQSFADSATSMLNQFAKWFATMPDASLDGAGVRSVYSISMGIAAAIAVLLLLGQVARTALTHDGRHLAAGLLGIGKLVMACLLILTISTAALEAADELTNWIITQGFGSDQALSDKISGLMEFQSAGTGTTLLVVGLIGIIFTLVLWFELLVRNAAVAILIATSPIAAAGMLSDGTKAWWTKLCAATIQLIIMKPIIALVMLLGVSMAGESSGLYQTLVGLLVLFLAVLAWPVIAKFFTFASVSAATGGLGAAVGFVAGQGVGRTAAGPPRAQIASAGAGGSDGSFAQQAEGRSLAQHAIRSGGGNGGASVAKGFAAAAAFPAAMAVIGAQAVQKATNTMSSKMETAAGHAGLHSNPHANPAGREDPYGMPLAQATRAKLPSSPTQKQDWSQSPFAVPREQEKPTPPPNPLQRETGEEK
jgi:hypothetical protein